MTLPSRNLYLLQKTPLITAFGISFYLLALLLPIIPAQIFVPCTGGFSCPPIPARAVQVPGGFVVGYLYSITLRLTGFGAYYTSSQGYTLPGGPYDPQADGLLLGFGAIGFLILPLSIAAISCFIMALRIRQKQRAVFRRFA